MEITRYIEKQDYNYIKRSRTPNMNKPVYFRKEVTEISEPPEQWYKVVITITKEPYKPPKPIISEDNHFSLEEVE